MKLGCKPYFQLLKVDFAETPHHYDDEERREEDETTTIKPYFQLLNVDFAACSARNVLSGIQIADPFFKLLQYARRTAAPAYHPAGSITFKGFEKDSLASLNTWM